MIRVQPPEEDVDSGLTLLTRPQPLFRFYRFLLSVLFLMFSPCHFRLAGRICAFSHKGVTALLIPDVPSSMGHRVGSAVGETQILVLSCPKTRPSESHLPTRRYACSQRTDKDFRVLPHRHLPHTHSHTHPHAPSPAPAPPPPRTLQSDDAGSGTALPLSSCVTWVGLGHNLLSWASVFSSAKWE